MLAFYHMELTPVLPRGQLAVAYGSHRWLRFAVIIGGSAGACNATRYELCQWAVACLRDRRGRRLDVASLQLLRPITESGVRLRPILDELFEQA